MPVAQVNVLRSESEHQHIENAKVHDRADGADDHEFQEPPEFFAVLLSQSDNCVKFFSSNSDLRGLRGLGVSIFNTVNTPNSAPINKWVLLTYRLSNK